jgi:hypothetical protein
MSVTNLEWMEDGVFLNEEWLRKCSKGLGQFIIVDCGYPRSLMGDKELVKLKELVEVQEIKVKDEGFRFGPSRIYISNKKVRFAIQVGVNSIECEFFVVTGEVPILLGNNVMAPIGGNIDMDEDRLVLKKAEMEIPLERTKGGHFVIPIRSVTGQDAKNIRGDKAKAVMLLVVENTENDDLLKLHDNIGHNAFLSLVLNDDEKAQVKKVDISLFRTQIFQKNMGIILQ